MESRPWPVQADAALGFLRWAMLRWHGPERIVEFALTLPCETADDARLLRELSHEFVYDNEYFPPAAFGAFLHLLRSGRLEGAAAGAGGPGAAAGDLLFYAQIDPVMTEVLVIDLVERGNVGTLRSNVVSPTVALTAARQVADESLPLQTRAEMAHIADLAISDF